MRESGKWRGTLSERTGRREDLRRGSSENWSEVMCGIFGLVVSGEVYNFTELRRPLEEAGVR
jgi:hypothetical protein